MTITLTGSIVHVGEIVTVKDTFRKRDIVVRIDEDQQYPQEILCQLSQDRCADADPLKPGQNVTLSCNLRGKSYDKKDGSGKGWFTSIDVWRLQAGAVPPPQDPGAKFDDVPF